MEGARRDTDEVSYLNPMTWEWDYFLLRGKQDVFTRSKRKERIVLVSIYLSIFVVARFWLFLVAWYVPEPYLVSLY